MVKQMQNKLGHLLKQSILVMISLLCYSLFSVALSATAPTSNVISVSTPPLEDANRLITLSIKPTQLMLGESITVTIVGEHRANLFEELDWGLFEKNFVLYDIDRDSERIKVKLYPLQSGSLHIKGQTAGRMVLPDIDIKVTPNPEVSVSWFGPNTAENATSNSANPASFYFHQQMTWKAEVQVNDTAHKVTYEQRASSINRSVTTYLQALPVDSQTSIFGESKDSQADQSSTKTETLVASYEVKDWPSSAPTLAHKKVLLHSPVVVVKNRSNKRWYFFDKPSRAVLKQLPNFLPITVAVGTIGWQNEPVNRLQTVGDLNYWTWQLQGKGLTKETMNSVAHQLVAQIGHNPQIEWLSDSREMTLNFTTEGLQSNLNLRLPYRVIQPGLVTLPTLQLRYFNPHSEKLEVILHSEATVLALPAWIVWIGQWLLLLLSVFIVFIGLLTVKQAWLNWRLQHVIKQADSVDVLWQGLLDWRQNQSYQAWSVLKWPKNLVQKMGSEGTSVEDFGSADIGSKDITKQSLATWSQWYVEQFGQSEAFEALITKLNFILYADQDKISAGDWQTLSESAQAWSRELNWWQIPLLALPTRFK